MKLYAYSIIGILWLPSLAVADYIGMSAEMVGVNLLEETTVPNYTIRIYADINQGDRIEGVFGSCDQPLFATPGSGTEFYQSNYGGPTSTSINPNFFSITPDLQWDSYMTIGALDRTGDPFENNALMDIGVDWTNFESGGELEANNGIWFVTPDDSQGQSINGRVLIAQLTIMDYEGTHELPSFGANFIGHDAAGNSWQAWGDLYWIPTPATIALLPMAILVGRRRRRS